MKSINIMTSCDDRLAPYILPQITGIGVNLSHLNVNFYLFHYRITQENVKNIRDYAGQFSNITFHEVIVNDLNFFEKLAKNGGNFPVEAYFYLNCHEYFSKEIDRVLYIDAGDIIINGDISEYYFDDFEGKSFIITPDEFAELVNGKPRPLGVEDLNSPHQVNIMRHSYVNSGCIVVNLNKFREEGRALISRCLHFAKKIGKMKLPPIQGKSNMLYLGDQGILGVAFIGDMKFFGFEIIKKTMDSYPVFLSGTHKYIRNLFKPYNFTQYHYNEKESCWFAPAVLHYASPHLKPWHHKYSLNDLKNPQNVKLPNNSLTVLENNRQVEMHRIWWRCFDKTAVKTTSPSNATWYLSEHYLAQKNFDEAEKHIIDLKPQEDIFNSLQIRLFSQKGEFVKSLSIIDDVINKLSDNNYMLIHFYDNKGYCHFQQKDYDRAANAYQNGYITLEKYLNGEIVKNDLIFVGDTAPLGQQVKCLYARNIVNCYYNLKNYDEAFIWLNKIPLSNKNDVLTYFQLVSESGQGIRIKDLFYHINEMQDFKTREACLVAFESILLPNVNAANILALFYNDYINLTNQHKNRGDKKQ